MFDEVHLGFLAGDDYERAAELRAADGKHNASTADEVTAPPGLPARFQGRYEDNHPSQVGK